MLNETRPTFFVLLGIPGLEPLFGVLGLVFFLVYMMSLIGNVTLLVTIRLDRGLHEPMYLFLSMLSSVDLALSASTTPKMLAILWFGFKEIHLEACLTQMFFIHSCATIQSSVLLAMAFDRYVAICRPLRYTSILTSQVVSYIGLVSVGRGVGAVLPLPVLFRRLLLCGNHIIHHSFCDHMAVVRLACSDITINSIYGLAVAIVLMAVDLSFIVWSYLLILRAVFRLRSRDAQFKALGTCTSHICTILVFYVTAALISVVQRVGKTIPLYVPILLANVYMTLPAFVNPIVYGMWNKKIRHRMKTLLLYR